jgi:hypothetical protein
MLAGRGLDMHFFKQPDAHRPLLPLYSQATFRRKIEALGCCRRIAQGLENCKVEQI